MTTPEQMIAALDRAARLMEDEALTAAIAFIRRATEPSDEELDAAARAFVSAGFKSSREPLPDTEANEQWVEFRKHQDAGFLAALATLHQPAPAHPRRK